MNQTDQRDTLNAPNAEAEDALEETRTGTEDLPLSEAVEQADADAAPDGELSAARERHLRLSADFDNYRKRTERERTEAWVRAQAQLIERLLEPLDDLQRVAHLDPAAGATAPVLDGVQMVERKLLRALEAAGLERIEAEGKPFNPEFHEAIATTATDDEDADDTVAQVFQQGYNFKGTLVRPARVQVNKYQG